MTAMVPDDPTMPDWRRLVAGTIAAYWAPLRTTGDGTRIPDADLADETDYGQAEHILAALLRAGAYLPGVASDELAWLRHLDPDPDAADTCADPMLSLTILLPRSAIERLGGDAAQGHAPNASALARRLVLAGLHASAAPPTTHDHHDTQEHP